MNPPDPKRTHEEQIDHDLRGLRMEIEQFGRMLYEEVGKSRAIKARVWRQVWFNRVVIVLIAVLFMLTTCQHAKSFFGGFIFMGASNGTELFNSVCKTKPTLWECTNCCLTLGVGLPHEEQLICVDLCIEKHGGAGSPKQQTETVASVLEAANVVREHQTTDVIRFNNAKRFLRTAMSSKFDRIRNLSAGLCRELGIVPPASA